MNKLYMNFIIILLIIFVFAQIYCINKMNNEKNIRVYNTQNNIYNHKTLNELNSELNCLNDKNIISANEIDGKWRVKVKLSGSKEYLVNEISKLKNYEVSDYVINKNKEENFIILEISEKEIV